jgi:hypothetical protein
MPEGNTFRERVRVWARRYLPAELASYAVTLPAISAALALTDSSLVAAVAGTWVEFLVYYGTIAWCTLRDERLVPLATLRTLGALLVEFGPAELLDSFVVRPSALYLALSLAPHPAIGSIAGKLAADAVFYLFTILSYELLRRARAGGRVSGKPWPQP